MAPPSEDAIGRRCAAVAFTLCLAHILTVAGTFYQVVPTIETLRMQLYRQPLEMTLVNFATLYSPVFILLLFRREPIVVGIFGIPVLIFFILRMHSVWEFYWSSINSMAVQKGDGLNFFTMIFEMFCAVIAAFGLLVVLASKLIDVFLHARRR